MVATDKVFAGSIPELYDRLMVPLIFEPYAAGPVERVAAVQLQSKPARRTRRAPPPAVRMEARRCFRTVRAGRAQRPGPKRQE